MVPVEILARRLRWVTLAFLALPAFIFLVGWLRWPLALAASGMLGLALWRDWRGGRDRVMPGAGTHDAISWRWLLAGVVLPAGVLTMLSGAGGWGAGDSDWLKHDTLLRDLLARPWPVTYESGQGPMLLVYYVAFYLPAALLGKLAGGSWTVASQGLALTTFTGIALAGGWLVVLGGGNRPGTGAVPRWRRVVVPAAVFIGFSGLDVLGKMGVNLFFRLPVFYGDWSDIEWWAQFAQYSANAATVFWAPQHAFGGWLPLALALDDWFRDDGPERRAGLYGALALMWSPFAAVGLLPLLGGMILWRRLHGGNGWTAYAHLSRWQLLRMRLRATRGWWRRLLTLANGAGALTGGIFALFLAAHFQSYPLPDQYKISPGFHPMPILTVVPRAVLWLAFVGIEFAGYVCALAVFLRPAPCFIPAEPEKLPLADLVKLERGHQDRLLRHLPERVLLWLATFILLVLPWFRYGYANDLVMRGGIASLFVLQVLLVRMFVESGATRAPQRRAAMWLAAALFIVGSANTFLEYRRHVVKIVAQGSWRDGRTREPIRTLAELHRTIYARPGFDFTRQYLGAMNSPFGRYLAARRGALRPDTPPGRQPDF